MQYNEDLRQTFELALCCGRGGFNQSDVFKHAEAQHLEIYPGGAGA
jgi:hypothetical protein